MKATVRYAAGKASEIDGLEVLYSFVLKYEDFKHLTPGIAQSQDLPHEFAICHSDENISGVCVFGRYGTNWFRVRKFDEFVIKHLTMRVAKLRPQITITKRNGNS